jgi:hypothetical protein
MQLTELGDKRWEKQREERLQAYRTMAMLTATVDPTEPYELKDLADAYTEIELISDSPEIIDAAWRLYGDTFRARKAAREVWQAGIRPAEQDESVRLAIEKSHERRDRFIQAVKTDLSREIPAPQQTPVLPS